MTSSRQRSGQRSRFTTFDWLAMLFMIFGFVLVLGSTTLSTVTGGELVTALTVLAGAFIVRGGISRTAALATRGEPAPGRRSSRVRLRRPTAERRRVSPAARRGPAIRPPRRPVGNHRTQAPLHSS